VRLQRGEGIAQALSTLKTSSSSEIICLINKRN
jgi:hypothetical protein